MDNRRTRIPDYLALVGDSADGYPGIAGIGPKGAASLIARCGPIEDFPPQALGGRRDLALLFKNLATLRTEAPIRAEIDQIRWRGPTDRFAGWTERLGAPKLLQRARAAIEASTAAASPAQPPAFPSAAAAVRRH